MKRGTASPSGAPAILVTGAAGALARRLIERLRPQHPVVAVDFRHRALFDTDVPSYRLSMDRRELETLFRRHRIDRIVHLGRLFGHEQNPQRRYSANVIGTKSLLDLARKYGVGHVVVHSTYSVYGASPYNPALIDEDWPLKAGEWTDELVDAVELEHLAQIHLRSDSGMRVTVLRPCNILGPGVRNTLSLMLRRAWAPVMAGYGPMMQFLHVEDMADALAQTLALPQSGVFNVAPADWVPYPDAVRLCGCRAIPLPSSTLFTRLLSGALGSNSLLPAHLVPYMRYPVILEGAQFRSRFNWTPRHRLDDLFAHYRRAKS